MKNSRRHTPEPASIVLTLHPVLEPTSDFDLGLEDLPMQQLESNPCTVANCLANRAAISKEYRQRFLAGDPRAIARLLHINREFITEAWVQEALQQDTTLREVVGPRGGRPVGRSASAEARGLALVAYVTALQNKTGRCLEEIFVWLGEGRIGLSSGRIRDLFYETVRDERNRSILFEMGHVA